MTTLPRRRMPSSTSRIAAVALLTLLVGGCSDEASDAPEGPDDTQASASGPSSPSGADGAEADPDAGDEDGDTGGDTGGDTSGGPVPDLPSAPSLTRPTGATEDVTMRGPCGLEPGEQTVGGRVENPTGRRLDYVINVSWVSDDGRVRGRAVASVTDVGPGASTRWSATTEIVDDAAACVTNALRGRLGS